MKNNVNLEINPLPIACCWGRSMGMVPVSPGLKYGQVCCGVVTMCVYWNYPSPDVPGLALDDICTSTTTTTCLGGELSSKDAVLYS